MKPLYEIANEYQDLMLSIMEADELSDEQLGEIEKLNDDINNKAVNVAAFIKNLEVESKGIKAACESMEERFKKIDKKIESLTNYLKNNLERCDVKEVKSPYFDIRIKINPAAVIVSDEKLIPEHYFREVIARKLDKFLISQELKNNIIIPGVLLEKKTRLEIR